jgi:hypothetical protein
VNLAEVVPREVQRNRGFVIFRRFQESLWSWGGGLNGRCYVPSRRARTAFAIFLLLDLWNDSQEWQGRRCEFHPGGDALKKFSGISPTVEDRVSVLKGSNRFCGRLKQTILKFVVQREATLKTEDHAWWVCRIVGFNLKPNFNAQNAIQNGICC